MKRHIFITTCVGIIMFLLGILLERGGIEKTQVVSEKEVIVAESQSPQIRIFNQNIEWYDGSNWNLLSPVAELEGKDPFVEAGKLYCSFRQKSERKSKRIPAVPLIKQLPEVTEVLPVVPEIRVIPELQQDSHPQTPEP